MCNTTTVICLFMFALTACSDHEPLTLSSAESIPTIFISDIDDTIKITHVNSLAAPMNALKNKGNFFTGMDSLYRWLACRGKYATPGYGKCLSTAGRSLWEQEEENRFYYVTGFPLHAHALDMIEQNHFPLVGEVIDGNLSESVGAFKLRAHKQIIAAYPQHRVILIGDNGQRDAAVFTKVKEYFAQENPSQKIASFIHLVYGESRDLVLGEHIPFLTFYDLAIQMNQLGLLTRSSLQVIFSKYQRAFANPDSDLGQRLLPHWVNCHGYHQWYQSKGRPSLNRSLIPPQGLAVFEEFLTAECP